MLFVSEFEFYTFRKVGFQAVAERGTMKNLQNNSNFTSAQVIYQSNILIAHIVLLAIIRVLIWS